MGACSPPRAAPRVPPPQAPRGPCALEPQAALPLETPVPGPGCAVVSGPAPSGLPAPGLVTASWNWGRTEGWGWGDTRGFRGSHWGRTASAPPPSPRRPRLRGFGNQMAAPLESLLQSRGLATLESASRRPATSATAGAWWRCLPALNLCDLARERGRCSHSQVSAAPCGILPLRREWPGDRAGKEGLTPASATPTPRVRLPKFA